MRYPFGRKLKPAQWSEARARAQLRSAPNAEASKASGEFMSQKKPAAKKYKGVRREQSWLWRRSAIKRANSAQDYPRAAACPSAGKWAPHQPRARALTEAGKTAGNETPGAGSPRAKCACCCVLPHLHGIRFTTRWPMGPLTELSATLPLVGVRRTPAPAPSAISSSLNCRLRRTPSPRAFSRVCSPVWL